MKCFTFYFAHETNSFSPIPTSLRNFEEAIIYRPQMGDPWNHPEAVKGAIDFVREGRSRGHEVIVGSCPGAQPSAPCARADYEQLRDEILDQLRAAAPVDIILIMMHGSMMAEGYEDCEGDILSRIREIVGPDVPIGVLLDLHCNLTQRMLEAATVIIPCKEYPHTDFAERARELYDIIEGTAKGCLRPMPSFYRVPVLGLFETVHPPMKDFVARLIETEQMDSVLSASLAHGFPWGDFPDAGAGTLVYTDSNPALGEALARELGKTFFEIRESAQAQPMNVQGLIAALQQPGNSATGTIVIADQADNPGGGAASDSTFLLRAFLDADLEDALFGYFWDPAAVDLAFAAGEGAILDLDIGGKIGPDSGDPVSLTVRVQSLRTTAKQPHIADGTACALGRTAVVEHRGVTIVLNDIRQQPFHPHGFEAAGVDPWAKKYVVVKSSYHFYAGFGERAAKVLYVDTPGTLHGDPKRRPYKRLGRPVWPLDEVTL